MESVKLQKYVSDCGLMSRRQAENAISDGLFTVNGVTAVLGDRVIPGEDVVKYRGKVIKQNTKKYYIMLNKPQGYVTTTSDEFGRDTVCSLIDLPVRLYPVGRLDKNSEGLLIMTNDGDFANRMMHPRYDHKKRYLVITSGYAENNAVDKMQHMRELDGEPINPVEIKILERNDNATKLVFTLSEGKNREIRRICEEAGLSVMQLKRFAVGPLQLGELESGKWRYLTPEEIKELTKKDDNHKAKSVSEKSRQQRGGFVPDRQKRNNGAPRSDAGRGSDGKRTYKDNGARNKPYRREKRDGGAD